MPVVLLVDDDDAVRSTLARLVSRHGHVVLHASSATAGVTALRENKPDLIITDMEMPDGTGFEVLEAALRATIPVVILTGHASVSMAVDAMRRGAANFLSKPFNSETVGQILEEAFGPPSTALRGTGQALPEGFPSSKDAAFCQVLEVVERVADTDATILLTGESGTGKEVVARAIHACSKRSGKAFAAINCGAIPEALLESELFGHARGAFTGATNSRRGRFQVAEGGTLFLDEIGDMSPVLQVKLPRVLQEKTYEVLGESNTRTADIRFIAATHRDLPKMVSEGTFREDLYYRLNVVPLHLPPLRHRTVDIPDLVKRFVAEANATHGRAVTGLSDEAMQVLMSHPWPGNVRELSNVVERAVLLKGRGTLLPTDLPALRLPAPTPSSVPLPSSGIDLGEALQKLEGGLIEQALERVGGNRTLAANLLGINRTTLVEKLKRRDTTR
jgi:DNA-binding NtrC family response regulator